MALKITVLLIIAGMLAESRSAAVNPLRATPVPGFNVADQAAKAAMSAPNGVMAGMDNIKSVTDLVPVPSLDDTVKTVQGIVKLPDLNIVYGLTKLVVGLLAKVGQSVADLGQTQFKVTINATVGTDGVCEISTSVDPVNVDVNLDISGLNPLNNAVAGAPLNNLVSGLADLLKSVLASVVKVAVDDFLNGPASKIPLDELCRNIAGNDGDSMPSPFPCPDEDQDDK